MRAITREMIERAGVELDPKDDDDRALLRSLPAIGAALLPLLARAEERIVVLFSTRRGDSPVRVLGLADARARSSGDAELAAALEGAPPQPLVRLLALRRDGTLVRRDVPVTDITEAEDTFPA